MTNFNESEVYRWFDVFKKGNQLTEIRIISNDGNKTGSGYFSNATVLVNALKEYASDYNVYFVINSINPDCYGRPQRDKIMLRPKNTTTDNDIIGRDYVLLDLDSKRTSGVNATNEQLSYAKKKANDVYKFLMDNGFYKPIVVCSGSGVHIYLRCALKASEENDLLVKRFLLSMGMLFSDEHVEIDCKVFNRARISRVVGFYNRKGSKLDSERPQRMCSFVTIPQEIKINEKEYFEKIASLYPEEEIKPNVYNNYSTERFDLDAFIAKHNIQVTRVENINGGKKYILDHCLFNEEHRGKDAVIFQRDNGAISYYCFHNSCEGNDWHKVRLMFEPDAYSKKDNSYRNNYRHYEKEVFKPKEETKELGKKWLSMSDISPVDISELMSIPTGYHELDKKIIGLLAGELTILSGLNASGKTSFLDCLSLNVVQSGYKVAIWSGEMQGWRFQGWIDQMAAGKNCVNKKDGYDNLYYCPSKYATIINKWLGDKLFLYNNDYGSDWQQLFSDIKNLVEKEGTQLVILDNLAALSIDGYDGEKYSKQTKFVIELKEYAKQKNIHIILVCHPRKENYFLRKESISGTADLTNIADNVILIHRVGKDFEVRAGEFLGKEKVQDYLQYSAVLEVAKNRQMGVVDYLVGLFYETESRRLKNSISEHIVYGWQEEGVQEEIGNRELNNFGGFDGMADFQSISEEEAPF